VHFGVLIHVHGYLREGRGWSGFHAGVQVADCHDGHIWSRTALRRPAHANGIRSSSVQWKIERSWLPSTGTGGQVVGHFESWAGNTGHSGI
jgi:hypothetical protein